MSLVEMLQMLLRLLPISCKLCFLLLFSFIFIRGCWILSNAFSSPIETTTYLLLILLVWYIIFIEFWVLNQLYIPRISPIGLGCINLLICFWSQIACCFVEVFCIYIHERYWSILFLSCDVSVLFWYQGNPGLREWGGKISLLFNYLGEFVNCW